MGAQLGDIAPHIDLQRSASLMFDHAKDRMVAFGPGARRQGRAAIEYASALEQVVTFSGESHVQDHHHMMAVPDEQLDSCPTSAQVERRSMVGQDYVAVELEFEGRTLDADVALDVSLLPELDMLVSQKMQLVADMDAVRMAAALGDDDFGFVVVNTELALRPSLSELLQVSALRATLLASSSSVYGCLLVWPASFDLD